MTLIEKIEIDGTKIMFYDGIDFDMAIGHSDDSEFLIFFVESYVAAAKAWTAVARASLWACWPAGSAIQAGGPASGAGPRRSRLLR